PVGVRAVPRPARPLVGLPVGAVPHRGVPARQQERRHAEGVRARRRGPGHAARRARGPGPVRRGAALPGPPRARGTGAPPGARLDPAARDGPGAGAGVRTHLWRHRRRLGGLPPLRGPGGPGDRVPALAVPPHAHGHAHHRLQARHRGLQRRRLPQAGARADVLPRAVRGAHAHGRAPGRRRGVSVAGPGAALPAWAPLPAWALALALLAAGLPGLRDGPGYAAGRFRVRADGVVETMALLWFNTGALMGVVLHFLGATVTTILLVAPEALIA